MNIELSIVLPKDFGLEDFLEFHSRDTLSVSEHVTPTRLEKGIMWLGLPACLSINFVGNEANVELSVDGDLNNLSEAMLETLVRRMLGLTQPTQVFEDAFRNHHVIGPLIKKQSGLRVPQTASLFEALTWAVTGQQISIGAAISVRRKLIQHIGVTHSSGIICFPDAQRLASISEINLRELGYSKNKAITLNTISKMVIMGDLPLETWSPNDSVDEMRQTLLSIKGIGNWTVNYFLMRGLAWLDGSLHGDVAVRNKLASLLERNHALTENETRTWLEQFAPWRALVAAHLWNMNKPNKLIK